MCMCVCISLLCANALVCVCGCVFVCVCVCLVRTSAALLLSVVLKNTDKCPITIPEASFDISHSTEAGQWERALKCEVC